MSTQRKTGVLWQPSEGCRAWSSTFKMNVTVVRVFEKAQTATLLVRRGKRPLRGRGRREGEMLTFRGELLSTLSEPRVLVGDRYVERHTPEAQAQLAKYPDADTHGVGSVPRFSGQVRAHVSREPIGGEYVVILSAYSGQYNRGESVRVPPSEVAHLTNAAERYDVIAAMAIARSRDIRGAEWIGGPGMGWDDWRGYFIERHPIPPQGRRWDVVLGGERYEVVEHPSSYGLRVERAGAGGTVWTGVLLGSGEFSARSSTLTGRKLTKLLGLVRDGDPLRRGQRSASGPPPTISDHDLRGLLVRAREQRDPPMALLCEDAIAGSPVARELCARELVRLRALMAQVTDAFEAGTLGVGSRRAMAVGATGEILSREEHLQDVVRRSLREEVGATEAVAELMARDFAAPVLLIAHEGLMPVEPRPRPGQGGFGLFGQRDGTWFAIAIRPDGWPVLAPGPEGSVETWPTKAAVQAAIDAAKRAERNR